MNPEFLPDRKIETKTFPKESLFGDAHTLILGDKEYDVYKLIDYTREIVPVETRVETLKNQLSAEQTWSDSNNQTFSSKDLLTAYTELGSWEALELAHPEWTDHINKTKTADYRYPIILYKGELMDGTHRLVRAIIEKVEHIPVRNLEILPEDTLYVPKGSV